MSEKPKSADLEKKVELIDCTVLLPAKNLPRGDLRRTLVGSLMGGNIDETNARRSHIRALSNVSIDIYKGDTIGVVGANGAGKSTLLKVISGVFIPQAGTAKINGKVISLLSLSSNLENDLTAEENLPYLCVQFGLDIKDVKKQIKEIIDFTELGEFFFQPVKTYSSGMRMRLLLAIATMAEPDILIMDEWISAGDAAFRQKSNERIEKLVKASGTLILASHSFSLLREWTKTCILLHRGKVVDVGPTDEILELYNEKFVLKK